MRYLLVVSLLAAACTTGPGGPNAQQTGKDEYSIPYGQAITLPGTVFEVRFQAVLADSRCPSDVVCVWEGEGKIELGLTMGDGPTIPVELNTHGPVTTSHAGYTITLVALNPYPVSTRPQVLGHYVAVLRVSAAGS
jgi:hypothetical protein